MTDDRPASERAPAMVEGVRVALGVCAFLCLALFAAVSAGDEAVLGDPCSITCWNCSGGFGPPPPPPSPSELATGYALCAVFCPIEAGRRALADAGYALRRDEIAPWFVAVALVLIVLAWPERRTRSVWVTRAVVLALGCGVLPLLFVPMAALWCGEDTRRWYARRARSSLAGPVRA